MRTGACLFAELAKRANGANAYSDLLWLGGRQRDYPSNKAWSWTDGKPFAYTNWDEPEPNNQKGEEHCIQ
ncbi:hypothetical protein TELCIR_23186, partial [Teladorsagia circumcincta]